MSNEYVERSTSHEAYDNLGISSSEPKWIDVSRLEVKGVVGKVMPPK